MKKSFFFLMAALTLASAVLFFPRYASAFMGDLPATNVYTLPSIDWPNTIQTSKHCSGSCVALPNFDPENSSYVIGASSSESGDTATLKNLVFFYSDASKLEFSQDSNGFKSLDAQGSPFYKAYAAQLHLHTGDSSQDYVSVLFNASGGSFNPDPVSDFVSIYVAKNVLYSSSWVGMHYSTDARYGTIDGGAGASCGALDFGCWIGKAANGLQDALASYAISAGKFLANMFVPDVSSIKSSFDNLSAFLSNQLGFLSFPVTFFGNVFSAFTSPSSWCTPSSCTKDFGSFFGSDFSFNFLSVSQSFPSLWTFLTQVLRGLTIVGLLFMLRSKFLEVMRK